MVSTFELTRYSVLYLNDLILFCFFLNYSFRTAHALGEGDIDVEDVVYERVDLVVHSLRGMVEHRHLVTSWSAMLQALKKSDTVSPNAEADEHKMDAIRQRVILRFLTCAAELEVEGAFAESYTLGYMDQDFHSALKAQHQSLEVAQKKAFKPKASSHEQLTLALVDALPGLLDTFKGVSSVLENLTRLPQCFRKYTWLPFLLMLNKTCPDLFCFRQFIMTQF
jgi:hypothetical protein